MISFKEYVRDYKAEYKKFQSSPERIKYRAELVKYNREKGTYGNGDGKDASHKSGKIVGFENQSKTRGRAEASRLKGSVREEPRIPRKKGQPAGSDKHSDLYTDENPKGTIHGLKFATEKDAKASVSKIENSGKKHAHKIQAAIAMEQRAKVAGKMAAAAVYRSYIEKMKKITKKRNMKEDVSKSELDQIEKYADKLFAAVGIDVEFTRHFLDRVNDERNKKPINTAELIRLFRLTYKKYGKKIPKMGPDAQAVITDMETDINMPFVLNVDRSGMLDLVAKTVMRKKGFRTSNPILNV